MNSVEVQVALAAQGLFCVKLSLISDIGHFLFMCSVDVVVNQSFEM